MGNLDGEKGMDICLIQTKVIHYQAPAMHAHMKSLLAEPLCKKPFIPFSILLSWGIACVLKLDDTPFPPPPTYVAGMGVCGLLLMKKVMCSRSAT